jgi:hypothetical protein
MRAEVIRVVRVVVWMAGAIPGAPRPRPRDQIARDARGRTGANYLVATFHELDELSRGERNCRSTSKCSLSPLLVARSGLLKFVGEVVREAVTIQGCSATASTCRFFLAVALHYEVEWVHCGVGGGP